MQIRPPGPPASLCCCSWSSVHVRRTTGNGRKEKKSTTSDELDELRMNCGSFFREAEFSYGNRIAEQMIFLIFFWCKHKRARILGLRHTQTASSRIEQLSSCTHKSIRPRLISQSTSYYSIAAATRVYSIMLSCLLSRTYFDRTEIG